MPIARDVERIARLQAQITQAESATEERNELAFSLWANGLTQAEITEVLDRADRAVGGEGITLAAVQKMLSRMRADREAELLRTASVDVPTLA